ncbi:MAG: hypothetical protein UY28_C0002G0001, partial [Candidatus Amesbacteria bacterium GW2011_GWB1_48_13]
RRIKLGPISRRNGGAEGRSRVPRGKNIQLIILMSNDQSLMSICLIWIGIDPDGTRE